MVSLVKKSRIKKVICKHCKGNGYIKIKEEIKQCFKCESEGELYEYAS